jgi:hypothetical protein
LLPPRRRIGDVQFSATSGIALIGRLELLLRKMSID